MSSQGLQQAPTILNDAFMLADLAAFGKVPNEREEALQELCNTGKTLSCIAPCWPICATPAIILGHFCWSMDEAFWGHALQIVFDALPYSPKNDPVRQKVHDILHAVKDYRENANACGITDEMCRIAKKLVRPHALDKICIEEQNLLAAAAAKTAFLEAFAAQGLTEEFLPSPRKVASLTTKCEKLIALTMQRRKFAAR